MKVGVVLKVGAKGSDFAPTASFLVRQPQVTEVVLLIPPGVSYQGPGWAFTTKEPESTETLLRILARTQTDYLLWVDGERTLALLPEAGERCLSVAVDTGASIVYGDYLEHPVIDYELGSVRDNFDFGPLLFLSRDRIEGIFREHYTSYRWAGLYDVRLKLSRLGPVVHLREPLGEKRRGRDYEREKFSYLEAEREASQKEMEQALTDHLKEIGAYLFPVFRPLPQEGGTYPVEASVIIPVKDRALTIRDAVDSALGQKSRFSFNVIVVDNHSKDGTSQVLHGLSKKYDKLIILRPERENLEIGGCWNLAVNSPFCGRYAVQLDSDDLYEHEKTLEMMVGTLRSGDYAMVIGSYTLVDREGNILPPGVITHREWTEENGRNNALRVDGFGAPRAFLTSVLRKMPFPNVSYGEDYAAGLKISRHYRIGRIFESLYLCRRWEGNSDARLTEEQLNRYNAYKDRVRTIEILARMRLNRDLCR